MIPEEEYEDNYADYDFVVPYVKGTYAYPYISKITGTHPVYKFARSFIDRSCLSFGSDGFQYYAVLPGEGVYEVGFKRRDKKTKELISRTVYWMLWYNDVLERIPKWAVLRWVDFLKHRNNTDEECF